MAATFKNICFMQQKCCTQHGKKKNSFYLFLCCMQHFSNRFCCIVHKKTHGFTVKFSRRMQCSNVALHAHKNVAPWPQGFIVLLNFNSSTTYKLAHVHYISHYELFMAPWYCPLYVLGDMGWFQVVL